MNIIRVFDYLIIKLYDFYQWGYEKRNHGSNVGGVTAFLSIFFGINLISIKSIITKFYPTPFDTYWLGIILFLIFFFILNSYINNVIVNKKNMQKPKHITVILSMYLSISIVLFYLGWIVFNN